MRIDCFWLQRSIGQDLTAQIRRSIAHEPALAIDRHGKAGLRARLNARIARPRQSADRTTAIPLRKAASGRRSENERRQAAHQGCHSPSIKAKSEFRRQVAVDLEADADLDKG